MPLGLSQIRCGLGKTDWEGHAVNGEAGLIAQDADASVKITLRQPKHNGPSLARSDTRR